MPLQPDLFSEAISQSGAAAEFLGAIIQASTEYSIFAKDSEGTVVLWNEGARRLYGYLPADILGRPSDILHAPEDLAAGLPQKMRQAALEDGKWEGVISRITRDQQRITARVVITPRFDEHGKVIGFLVISKDVSLERRLRERMGLSRMLDAHSFGSSTEDLLAFIVSLLQASTAVSIIGARTDGLIDLWNEGARRIYGYSPHEVVGRSNVEILHARDDVRTHLPTQILEAARREGRWSGDVRRLKKNGDLFMARLTVTPRYDRSGDLAGFVLISIPSLA